MKNRYSAIVVAVILIFSLVFTFNMRFWEKKQLIAYDVTFYYSYLPAIFIYHDLTLNFTSDAGFKGLIYPEKAPNGANMIKTTSGLAILYSPFFFLAHTLALISDWGPADGYSPIYGLFLLLSNIFYTIIGFVFLRKLLLLYVEDWIVATVLVVLFFCSNLFYYTLYDAMPHTYLLALINAFLYYIVLWHKKITLKKSVIVGLLFGLIVLIRPVHMVLFLLFCFYDVYSVETFKAKFKQYSRNIMFLLVLGMCALGVVSIQLMYWKRLSGNFFYWSYGEEHFFWMKPHIIDGLIGFRKGWYIYVPIMLPATVGLFLLKRMSKQWSLVLPVTWMIFTYIILCWWCWWYGGGFSIRPYVDIYGLMAMGLAAVLYCISTIKHTVFLRFPCFIAFGILALYSSFVVVQYHYRVIHYDSMNKETWKATFLKIDVPEGGVYWEKLTPPDYTRASQHGEDLWD